TAVTPNARPLVMRRRQKAHMTGGATSSACVGFEYVTTPSSTAATMSVHSPRKTDGCSSGSTSLYNQRKYARNTSAKWNISGVRNTRYTGTQVAPTKASANSNDASGVDRALRNV